jgi:hypothetical protein
VDAWPRPIGYLDEGLLHGLLADMGAYGICGESPEGERGWLAPTRLRVDAGPTGHHDEGFLEGLLAAMAVDGVCGECHEVFQRGEALLTPIIPLADARSRPRGYLDEKFLGWLLDAMSVYNICGERQRGFGWETGDRP